MKENQMEQIYLKYYNDIFSYAFALCGDYYNAQYLVSDTFFKAFTAIEDTFPVEWEIKYWLFRVCRNDYLNMQRKERRSFSLEGYRLPVPQRLEKMCDAGEIVLCREERRNLYGAVRDLPSPYKDCIYLHYFQDISLKDIARILEMSPGAVRTAIYRARRMLREILEDLQG